MSGSFMRFSVAASVLAILAGCSSSGQTDALEVSQSAPQSVTPVVQANCPQVSILDDQAVYRIYSGGAKGNAEKLMYQASLGDSTRACTMNGDTLTVHVMAQGRIVPGPMGKPGPVEVPIRVTVRDGDGEVFTNVMRVPVEILAGGAGNQFLYSNNNVTIPNGPGGAPKTTQVLLSFDENAKARR